MKTSLNAPQVDAPDPELRNSSIIDAWDRGGAVGGCQLKRDACYFNNQRFAIGHTAHGSDELLHCADRGVWIKMTEERPA